jgi:hypothetical protein
MIRFLLIVAGIAALLYWLGRSGPAHTAQLLRWLAVTMVALLLLLLTIRGGAGLALPLLTLLIPLLMRWRALWRPVPVTPSGAERNDTSSRVETRFLRMSLNHRTGEMQGDILEGRFKGRKLADLDLRSLLMLWQECQLDPQSVAILEAYLDRTQDDDWREQFDHWEETASDSDTRSRARDSAKMDRKRAYEILGLQPGASREQIKAAHRRLMQRVHPDHGGSTYLAAEINQAKDLLLNE